ncbi:MAG: thiamine-phosphate kinase [Gammaproteobacteria bacterium]|nr:thiamine-phosphate kinase [Gammaproteobacteria bacterium]
MNEFEIIDRITQILGRAARAESVLVGPGDDAAVVSVPPGFELAVTTDTLVAGRHFPTDAPGDLVGCRAMGVNLSDLAAMGASPSYCVVSLTIPQADIPWIEAYARGIAEYAKRYGASIVGGNIARGPLAVSVTAHGLLPAGEHLLRSGAQAGDMVFVSGTLGAGHAARLANDPRFYRIEPRIDLGQELRGWATAAIDISDGLLADLGHVCRASGVGARLTLEAMPVAEGIEPETAITCGDDYELLFTARERPDVDEPITAIGEVVEEEGITVLDLGRAVAIDKSEGYRHF